MEPIKVYGADWCGMTTATLEHLDELGLKYQYINVDEDSAAAQWVRDQNGGKEKKPTLDIGGEVVTAPSNRQLDDVLRRKGLLS